MTRTAIIVGSAATVWDDLNNLPSEYHGSDYIVINQLAAEWRRDAVAWCSLHGELLPFWATQRHKNGLPTIPRIFTGKSGGDFSNAKLVVTDVVEALFPRQSVGGSSGLFALKVALIDLGYDRAILCGIPMTASPHFNKAQDWADAQSFRDGWMQALPSIQNKAFSMSGWTRHLLGPPPELETVAHAAP